jgi:hypothetical protein
MAKLLKATAAALLLGCGATVALAQTTTPPSTTEKSSPSKAQPGAPTQGPGKQVPQAGSRPIGPPADSSATTTAPGTNPTGMSVEKEKSEANDPRTGGKKP